MTFDERFAPAAVERRVARINAEASWPLLQQELAELKQAGTQSEMQRRRDQPVRLLELDNLDDAAVQRTYQGTVQERAQRIRAAAPNSVTRGCGRTSSGFRER